MMDASAVEARGWYDNQRLAAESSLGPSAAAAAAAAASLGQQSGAGAGVDASDMNAFYRFENGAAAAAAHRRYYPTGYGTHGECFFLNQLCARCGKKKMMRMLLHCCCFVMMRGCCYVRFIVCAKFGKC